jgi:transcriptional regulator with XRE-family HTH domain
MTPDNAANRRQGRRLQPYFVAKCIDLRTQAKSSIEAVADKLGRKASAVERFESGKTWPAENLELYAAAYATIAGIDDPRDIYAMSLESWVAKGRKPLTAPALAALEEDGVEPSFRDLVESIRHAGERERARGEAAPQPISTPRSRAKRG